MTQYCVAIFTAIWLILLTWLVIPWEECLVRKFNACLEYCSSELKTSFSDAYQDARYIMRNIFSNKRTKSHFCFSLALTILNYNGKSSAAPILTFRMYKT